MPRAVNLLPPEFRRGRHWRRLAWPTALLVPTLALAAWAGVLNSQSQLLNREITSINAAAAKNSAALEQYRTLRQREAELAALAQTAGRPAPARAAVLRAVQSAAADVHLSEISVAADGLVTIRGEAAELTVVAGYIIRLNDEPILTQVRLINTSGEPGAKSLEFVIDCRTAVNGGGS